MVGAAEPTSRLRLRCRVRAAIRLASPCRQTCWPRCPGLGSPRSRLTPSCRTPSSPDRSSTRMRLEELKISIQRGRLPAADRGARTDRTTSRYELVMGERRWRAAQALGREMIPAIIRDTRDDAMLRDALLENIHRANLNPLEEAAAYQQLLEEFGATHEELARRIGRSRPQISNTIRLLNLPARSRAGWRRACCPPATRGRCLGLARRRAAGGLADGSSRKGCRCGRPRNW